MKSWKPHITLIRAALVQIGGSPPADKERFLDHSMAQDAIVMRLQEIGENLARMRHHDEEAFAEVADDSWFS